ncbi:hypothetical protein PR202_ga12029 [Eleusine coracana subsp. coracana]|uniref:Uncharacterized protein n=1 Tax=Eleusine coracana subsp. coracana TaxID=191504 RepID=A0AAV5CB69_ELECO|nr:hypothetical protein PR202_ga12029 [Eleusine coracana subsp. coracana]
MQIEIGDGANALFWENRWLHGQKIADVAPRLYATIPKRRIKLRTVQEALMSRSWIADIQGALIVGVIIEYLYLWDILNTFQLQPGVQDSHIWFANSGKYSAKKAYQLLSRVLFSLILMNECGGFGRLPNVVFLYGWWNTTDAGQLTIWRAEAWGTQNVACYAIRNLNLLTTFSVPASLHVNSGSTYCIRSAYNISVLNQTSLPLNHGGKQQAVQLRV